MSRMPTTDAARRTRDRVLRAALELFNEHGTASVTTNHVAARAGMSPGNLYYWFSDKDEIVRELYAAFVAEYEQLWSGGHSDPVNPQTATGNPKSYRGHPEKDRGHPQTNSGHPEKDTGQAQAGDAGDALSLGPNEVLARLADGAGLSRRYAFLARDLLGLLHDDPVLAAEYRRVRARRITEFTDLAGRWRRLGLIRPVDDGTVADLVQALWVIAETWLAFAELGGARADPAEGTRLLRVVLQPYLAQESVSAPGA